MSSERPWTAWWEARYRVKTAWFTDPDQDAIYRSLLAEYGEHGPLPNDDDELRAFCRNMPIERWNRWWPKIRERFFHLEPDGRLHNKRADEEWAIKHSGKPQQQAAAGAKGGNVRWAKERARNAAAGLPVQAQEAVVEYAATAARLGLQPMQLLTPERAAALNERLKEAGGLEGWKTALAKVEKSGFLRGEGKRGWKPDFDWITAPINFAKLMEGYYERPERAAKPTTETPGADGDFDERRRAVANATAQSKGLDPL